MVEEAFQLTTTSGIHEDPIRISLGLLRESEPA
jgi:hypothetical protein